MFSVVAAVLRGYYNHMDFFTGALLDSECCQMPNSSQKLGSLLVIKDKNVVVIMVVHVRF